VSHLAEVRKSLPLVGCNLGLVSVLHIEGEEGERASTRGQKVRLTTERSNQ
jgi:hypothetical protein